MSDDSIPGMRLYAIIGGDPSPEDQVRRIADRVPWNTTPRDQVAWPPPLELVPLEPGLRLEILTNFCLQRAGCLSPRQGLPGRPRKVEPRIRQICGQVEAGDTTFDQLRKKGPKRLRLEYDEALRTMKRVTAAFPR